MDISPTMIALIATGSTLLGSLIPNLVALRTARLIKESADRDRESEERKHRRDLLFKVSLDWWRYDQESSPVKDPLEEYITRMDAFDALFLDENPQDEDWKKKVANRKAWLEARKKRRVNEQLRPS
jgi:hypothetical protein